MIQYDLERSEFTIFFLKVYKEGKGKMREPHLTAEQDGGMLLT